jgi:hypothetical protein
MFNFPFYKYYNPLIINQDLRDYIKKSNTDSFNKFAQRNSRHNKLSSSLLNYRNYSANLLNNKISREELENEDYLHDFCNINNEDDNSPHDNDDKFHFKKNVVVLITSLIGGTTIIGFILFYYKN